MRYSLSPQQITGGVIVNEALFGGYESLQDALKSGVTFNVDFDRYFVCLTGIPRQLFAGHLHKSLDNFLEVYSAWRAQVLEYLHGHGIVADIAVVKYDQSKRICCIMSGFSDENGPAMGGGRLRSGIDPLGAAHFMHATYARLYELLWDVADTECSFVTALSDAASGFDALGGTFAQVDELSRLSFAESCTIKEIADHVGVSPNYLSRVFNREVGENISSYLARLRLRRAAVLLETTSDSVSVVGARTGFANASYFSTAFRQYFGMSPLEYRGRAVGSARMEDPGER